MTGANTLVVLPDETEELADEWPWPVDEVETVRVALPKGPPGTHHYRCAASIALAEIARRLGKPDSGGVRLRSRRDRFRREVGQADEGCVLDAADLRAF